METIQETKNVWETKTIYTSSELISSHAVDKYNNIYVIFEEGVVMKFNYISRGKYEDPITIVKYKRDLDSIIITEEGRIFCISDYTHESHKVSDNPDGFDITDIVEIFDNGNTEIYFNYKNTSDIIRMHSSGNIEDEYRWIDLVSIHYYNNSIYLVFEKSNCNLNDPNYSIFKINDSDKSLELIGNFMYMVNIDEEGNIYSDLSRKIYTFGNLSNPTITGTLIYKFNVTYRISVSKYGEIILYSNKKIEILKNTNELETVLIHDGKSCIDVLVDNSGDLITSIGEDLKISYRPSSGPKSAII